MKYLFVLIALFSIISCANEASDKTSAKQEELKRITIQGQAQGTYYRVIYFDYDTVLTNSDFDKILKDFDMSASNYVDSSIISKVNSNIEVELDKIFIDNFNLAKRIYNESEGYFDISVRPLIEFYGFGKTKEHNTKQSGIDSIMKFVGFDKVQLIDNKIVKEDSRVQLDFNAIAKGYAVDYLGDFLSSKSYKNYLVDIGGEVYAAGIKPDSSNWQVGVETPVDNASYGQGLSKVLSLEDKGMATSGNYRRFFEKDGKKYVHTINPKTGETVNSNLLSATVMCETTAEADAYATALMSMGLEKAIEFSENMDLNVFLIFANENGEFDFYISPEIENNISN